MERDERSPFTPQEILVLRGMIEEYEYKLRRDAFWRSTAGMLSKVIGTIGVLAVIAAAVKTLVYG